MPVNVAQQTTVFFACILTGIFSGIIFDVLNKTAANLHFKRSLIFIQDIIIWWIILAFYFAVIYRINGAQIRWYIFLGAFFGTVIYVFGVRSIALKIICKIEKIIGKILSFFAKMFMPLLRFSMKLFKPMVKYVQNARKKKDNFVQKMVEKIRRIKILLNKI